MKLPEVPEYDDDDHDMLTEFIGLIICLGILLLGAGIGLLIWYFMFY